MPETKTMFSGAGQAGQEGLHRLEDGVVAAAGAPADLLVGGVVLAGRGGLALGQGRDAGQAGEGQLGGGHRVTSSWVGVVSGDASSAPPVVASIRPVSASASSAARSGRPRTWL